MSTLNLTALFCKNLKCVHLKGHFNPRRSVLFEEHSCVPARASSLCCAQVGARTVKSVPSQAMDFSSVAPFTSHPIYFRFCPQCRHSTAALRIDYRATDSNFRSAAASAAALETACVRPGPFMCTPAIGRSSSARCIISLRSTPPR